MCNKFFDQITFLFTLIFVLPFFPQTSLGQTARPVDLYALSNAREDFLRPPIVTKMSSPNAPVADEAAPIRSYEPVNTQWDFQPPLITRVPGQSALALAPVQVSPESPPVPATIISLMSTSPQTRPAQPAIARPDYRACNWTGTYFGIQIGGGDGASRRNYSPNQNNETTKAFDVSGPVGGITLGHNEQFGSFVAGVESDFSVNGSTGQTHRPNPAYTYATDNPWFATFRPRAGYVFGHALPYVTGGLAMGSVRTSAYNTATGDVGTDYVRIALGWTAGTGVEVALSPGWSVKAEYMYLDLGDTTGPGDTGYPTTTSFNEHIGRVGLNYKFGEGDSLYDAWRKQLTRSADKISLGTLTGIELGGEVSNYRYQEHVTADSLFDKDNGTKLGVMLAATKAFSTGFFGRIDSRVAESHDEYSAQNGSHISNVPDYVGEISVTGGKDYVFDRWAVSPYTGLGYRNRFSDNRNGSSNFGPRSDSQYFYLPVGETTRFRVTNTSRVSLNVEYDHLIEGWKKEINENGNPNFFALQYNGYGLRGSAMYEWASWGVGPFFNYWNIDQSAEESGNGHSGFEPHNQTIEYGLQVRYRF